MTEIPKLRLPEKVVSLTFLPANRTFNFEFEKLAHTGEGRPASILDVAVNFGFSLDHACGGHCACTTCHVIVRRGEELLSEMQEDEAEKLDSAADLTLHSRLACQAQILHPGEIVVEVPSWNRNL